MKTKNTSEQTATVAIGNQIERLKKNSLNGNAIERLRKNNL
jgi:hypothetical protein